MAELIGALLITFLISRGFRTVFRKKSPPVQMLAPHALTLLTTTVLGGFGMADGGPLQFRRAFLTYLLPVIVWLVVDLVRDYRRAKAASQPSQP
jgi:hypothetical protein